MRSAGGEAVVSFATATVFADQPGGALGEAHAVLGAVDFSGGAATFPLVEGLAVVDVARHSLQLRGEGAKRFPSFFPPPAQGPRKTSKTVGE